MKRIKITKKALISKALFILAGTALVFVSCTKDEDPQAEVLDGVYDIKSVALATDFKASNEVTVPAEEDLTNPIKDLLFGTAKCAKNTKIELRDTEGGSKKVYFVCSEEEKDEEAGSWSTEMEGEIQTLTLNLTDPPLDANMTLTLKDVTVDGTELTGNVKGLGVPKAVLTDVSDITGEILDALDDVIQLDLDFEFTKQAAE